MPRASRVPSYRCHKPTGQALVEMHGKRHYLGAFGSPASVERYNRLIGEWRIAAVQRDVTRRAAAPAPPASFTVAELCAAYWAHCEGYYIDPHGEPSPWLHTIRTALRELRSLYGSEQAANIGPLALRALQQRIAETTGTAENRDPIRRTRTYVNKLVDCVRRAFRWGASMELVPVAVHQALATVRGLQRGRCQSPDRKPVAAVPAAVVDATLKKLPAVVRDMVRIQRHCGCRPSELCSMRPADIDRSGDIWTYQPATHKNANRGKSRIIMLGPKAQALLMPYLLRPADSYCFSPAESESKRKAELRTRRKTRVQPSQLDRSKRRPKRQPGEQYDRCSYAWAIRRACIQAEVEIWSPNRLRHSAGTEIRKRFGLETAAAVLGHARCDTTQIYAQSNLEKAAAAVRECG